MSNTKKLLVVSLVIVVGLVAGGAVAFWTLSSRNFATSEAVLALESTNEVTVQEVEDQDWWSFTPAGQMPDAGLIIYPGGLVDPVAYAPLAAAIAAEGFLVILDPMPLNLAVLDSDSASEIIPAFPSITTWAIGGHSLGGAMAAEFAANTPTLVDGLLLWAAYPAGGTDLSGLPVDLASVYGDADGVALVEEVLGAAPQLPADTAFVRIEGGNHTQFGYYGDGLQRGDNPATITRTEQQQQIVTATVNLLRAITPAP